jgi:hypothetical protein
MSLPGPGLGPVFRPDGTLRPVGPRARAPPGAPAAFLGRTADNGYAPVCVAWTGAGPWRPNCGRLWWSAGALGLPLAESRRVAGVEPSVELVPIEHLMWVLEPVRLCKAVTGAHWRPFEDGRRKQTKRLSLKSFDSRDHRRCSIAKVCVLNAAGERGWTPLLPLQAPFIQPALWSAAQSSVRMSLN